MGKGKGLINRERIVMILYTDLSQSGKLWELGIDSDTSDMIWTTDMADCFFEYPTLDWRPEKKYIDGKTNLPCWSHGALVKLMPDRIKGVSGVDLDLMINNNCVCYFDQTGMAHGPCFYGPDMIENAVKMVEWLKENKKI